MDRDSDLHPDRLCETLDDLLDAPASPEIASQLARAFGCYLTDVLPEGLQFVLTVGMGGAPCGVTSSQDIGPPELAPYLERLTAMLRGGGATAQRVPPRVAPAPSGEDDVDVYEESRAMCEKHGADAVLVVMKRPTDTGFYLTGRTDIVDGKHMPPSPEHLVPLLVAAREASLDIEKQLNTDPRFAKREEWLRYVQAIPSGYGITEARLYQGAPRIDLVRAWFEGNLAGEFVLPKGVSDDFLMTLGLKLEPSSAS